MNGPRHWQAVLAASLILAPAARAAGDPAAGGFRLSSPPPASVPQFSAPVRVTKVADGWRIGFAASCETDVTVAIVDAHGAVVRHLACGRLGTSPPEPLQPRSLEQSLVWDGRDDDGQPVTGSGCRVRVSLGLRPRFDGLIGDAPGAVSSVRALAVGPQGDVYVFHVYGALHPNDGTASCAVFSRAGQYLRTVLPAPAGLPEERLRGLRRVALPDGRRVPFLYQAETRSLIPGAGDLPPQRAVATRDGRIAFVGIQEWVGDALRYAQPGVAQVVVLEADGGTPADGVLKAILASRASAAASLALAPDEKTVYAAGLVEAGYPEKPVHAVLRFAWNDRDPAVFVGQRAESGAGPRALNRPTSVAVDGDGHVYVADRGNDRIAVFDAAGTFLGALPAAQPERVEVDARRGTIYVLGGPRVNQLQKFRDWRTAEPLAQAELPFFAHPRYTAVMALDAAAEPPVLWVGTPMGHYAGFGLLRIEDTGAAFGPPHDVSPPRRAAVAGAVTDVSINRLTGQLYTSSGSQSLGPFFDGPTGKELPLKLPNLGGSGNVAAFGADGNLYVFHDYPEAAVSRFSAAGERLPFASGDRLTGLGSPRVRGRGLTADRHGNVYVLWQKPKEKLQPGDAQDANALAVFDRDGRLLAERRIDAEIRSLSSVRVDRAGNIYLAIGVRPPAVPVPAELAALDRGRPWKHGMNSNELDWYSLLYGSIVKFGPAGGVIRADSGGVPVAYGYANKTEIRGAAWLYFGASSVPSWRTKGTPDVCLCESPRIHVDAFGRCFFPDAARFQVGVLDAAGNPIGFFGNYGNADSGGPASAVPQPEVAFGWPQAVAADDRFVYVGDRVNRRVVRVRLTYAAEQSCAVEKQ